MLDSFIQTFADPVAVNWWLTPFVSFPDSLRKVLPAPDSLSIICFALQSEKNFNLIHWGLNRFLSSSPHQREWRNYLGAGLSLGSSLGLSISKIAKMALFSNQLTLYTYSNIALSGLPLIMFGARYSERYLSPTWAAVVESATKCTTRILLSYYPIDLLFNKDREFFESAGMYASRCNVVAKIANIGLVKKVSSLAGRLINKPFAQKALGVIGFGCKGIAKCHVWVTLGLNIGISCYYYPSTRVAIAITGADKLFAAGKRRAARDLIHQEQQYDPSSASKEYAECIPLMEKTFDLKPNDPVSEMTRTDLDTKIKSFFTKIKNDSSYSSVCNNLLYHLTIANLLVKKYDEAKKVLKDPHITSFVPEQVIIFIINQMKSLSGPDAEQYLMKLENAQMFQSETHKLILQRYREYIHYQNAHPHLEENQIQQIDEQIQAIDALELVVRPREYLDQFYFWIQLERAKLHFDIRHNYPETNAVLRRTYLNKIFRRVFGLFWPIFDSKDGGNILKSY